MKYPHLYYGLFAQVPTLVIHLRKAVVLTISRNQKEKQKTKPEGNLFKPKALMFSLKPNRFQGQYKCLANLQEPVTIRLKVFIVLSICNFLVQTVINNTVCMKSYLSYAFDFLSLDARLLESEH